MYKNIFLNYNQGSAFGQNTALRLQTISNLYGLSVSLPARMVNGGEIISHISKERLSAASIVVAFGLEAPTNVMIEELKYAIQLQKPIVFIYDESTGNTINFDNYDKVQIAEINYLDTDDAIHTVAEFLEKLPESQKHKKETSLNTALIGVGLGLLALWALNKKDAEHEEDVESEYAESH